MDCTNSLDFGWNSEDPDSCLTKVFASALCSNAVTLRLNPGRVSMTAYFFSCMSCLVLMASSSFSCRLLSVFLLPL